ncbi:ligase-associated DNA damage response exonuclease [bacterium]|nr:ligase-associated DNA damage response exonuclease [bacterium]
MNSAREKPENWLHVNDTGLYCVPGDFYIDPMRPVEKAVVTHGHADHARPGHRHVLATPATIAIMQQRYGASLDAQLQQAIYGEMLDINGVRLSLLPAGHILGSSQVMMEYGGSRIIVSGDYKRRRDPTCEAFTPHPCDVFVTEATFGLPVFRHPPGEQEVGKLLRALELWPERCILLGAYALGKCQRVICLLREAGYHETIYLHGAMIGLCELYQKFGVDLGRIAPVAGMEKEPLKGTIIIAPPSALHDRWSRRFPDPITALASGWMNIRARARQKLVELPLIISDHADWEELTQTIHDTQASEIWVTHGREDALVHYAKTLGLKARPLDLHGYEDDEES